MHEQVDVIGLAVELDRLGFEVGADGAHDPSQCRRISSVNGPRRYLGVKTNWAWRVYTTVRPLRILGFGSQCGDIE
ncbi:hypothetical protein GCM10011579_095540 [Streptomyces albiflavescens]|uniref:Uncharacterized protein n=1 Tax=Streptomyces albiflavescens TaxID=1623582 RepID=A0A918DBC0_9ACTN|nr:hypothetical protein GCM10011579_095540 [Streptomyces albiflavescens]